jgi:hypothetical protein
MLFSRYSAGLFVLVVLGMLFGPAGLARGEDFRVDNAVYRGDEKQPSGQSTTIFSGGLVYDCLKAPAETVVFDKTAGQFILLNLTHRVRAELSTGEVAAIIEQLRPGAARSKDPLVRFLAEPKFQEQSTPSGELVLSSPLISYRLALRREADEAVVEQYHQFCDGYARLNALLGSAPPFGRLVVNAAIAQRRAIASQVVLTILRTGPGPKGQTTIRSEHRLVRPLESADLQQVAESRQYMDSFKRVGFDQYRKAAAR